MQKIKQSSINLEMQARKGNFAVSVLLLESYCPEDFSYTNQMQLNHLMKVFRVA